MPHAAQPRRSADFFAGVLLAIATTIIAALQPVAMRFGALNMDPLMFAIVAIVSAGVSGATVLAITGDLRELARREYAARLFLLSISGTLATSLLLIYGLHQIDAVAAVILLESEPIYSLLLATIFLGEQPARRQLIATAIILVGIGSVFGAGPAFAPLYAAALVFLTPLFWQISHVISLGVMPPLRPLCVTGARYIYSALMMVVIAIFYFPGGHKAVAPDALATAAFTGAFIYFLGSLTWYGAINRLSLTWTTALVIPGVPILSFVFAMVFLGERPSVREIAGILVAIIGVAALVTGPGAARQNPLDAAEAAHQPIA